MIKNVVKRVNLFKSDFNQVMIDFAAKIYLPHETRQRRIYEKVKDQTMIGALGVLANLDAIDYVMDNNIPGCIVECGVWKGGSVAAMLLRLMEGHVTDRKIYLYDTFAGMTAPTAVDKRGQIDVMRKFKDSQKGDHNAWCYSPLDEVRKNIENTGYPKDNIHFVQGDVLKTLLANELGDIALLRLDTDWYESTKAELDHLYPKVVNGGVVIIDDYGTWDGARKAVDEYFLKLQHKPLMYRIDQTRRMFVKQER